MSGEYLKSELNKSQSTEYSYPSLGQHKHSLQWVNSTPDSAGIPLKPSGRPGLKLNTLQK